MTIVYITKLSIQILYYYKKTKKYAYISGTNLRYKSSLYYLEVNNIKPPVKYHNFSYNKKVIRKQI